MAAPLATTDDLSARLSQPLTTNAQIARAAALLTGASAAVRAYVQQEISAARSTVRLRINSHDWFVRLPQRPATTVYSVLGPSGAALPYYVFDGFDRIDFRYHLTQVRPPLWLFRYVDVDYAHGYATVPDAVVEIVCSLAGRSYGRPVDQAYISREHIGAYGVTASSVAVAGPMELEVSEKAVLDSLFPKQLGVAWMRGHVFSPVAGASSDYGDENAFSGDTLP